MMGTATIINAFRTQSQACGASGSHFMAALLNEAANEIDHTGSICGLLASWPGDPVADAVPLRLAAALHALVLSKAAPDLAALYPASDQTADVSAVWRAALSAIVAHGSILNDFLQSPPQTNEVGRSAVLLGGFLEIARATNGRPMHMLEIGASAGLNQVWDRYRYDLDSRVRWGDPHASVVVTGAWHGPPPPLDAHVAVAGRAASDTEPVDLDDPDARLRLRAYVWADQPSRMALLDDAITLVRRMQLRVERAEAAGWVAHRLRERTKGRTTVLFHSIAWEYFSEETKSRISAAMDEAGQGADADSPLAWLRLEPPADSGPGSGQPELRLTLWPEGHDQRLAQAHTHGPPVTWTGADVHG
jgi:hypothetical protein